MTTLARVVVDVYAFTVVALATLSSSMLLTRALRVPYLRNWSQFVAVGATFALAVIGAWAILAS